MPSKMLIDAAHPEETRVVVVRGQRVEEFDYESAHKKQLRGNIYLAKVTRVEPSLQAAFVDYGGNRHGFLAFNEIHPDYYQIPVADRQALLEEEAEEESRAQAAEVAEDEAAASGRRRRGRGGRSRSRSGPGSASDDAEASSGDAEADEAHDSPSLALEANALIHEVSEPADAPHDDGDPEDDNAPAPHSSVIEEIDTAADADAPASAGELNGNGELDAVVESVGSEDALEELPDRPRRRRRIYKIQEVIKRRQIILIQVVKEERGNKGAALTTYLSLAGRYAVLMPNTARGGGISRKITQPTDRKRLRQIAGELEVPEGMGLIIRTAGAQRTKTEIKRDYDYLLRLWENVRDLTLKSTAPALVYEEGSLIKRSIRDLYNKDIDSILVAGDEAYREAKDFMRMLMPSHAKNVQPHKEPEPLFLRFQVERQLGAMFSPQVTLRSGGYIVINQTEALVSIDVNSGKSTREHNIEDTALRTNMEAAEEIARQLRLRDLAGLIVIDFIDMDERRNSRSVERKMKDSLRFDRARIQVGRISHFGLLEMSRQRLRTGMIEGSTSQCAVCQGTGIVRSTESLALDVLRSIEDGMLTQGAADIAATTSVEVALYILNQKRTHLKDIEQRYGVTVAINAGAHLHGVNFTMERTARLDSAERASPVLRMDWAHHDDAEDDEPAEVTAVPDEPEDTIEDGDNKRGGRRRRRRGGRGDREDGHAIARTDGHDTSAPDQQDEDADHDQRPAAAGEDGEESTGIAAKRPRRRGRRGGRRSRGGRDRPNGEHLHHVASHQDNRSLNDGPALPAVDAATLPFGDDSVASESARENSASDRDVSWQLVENEPEVEDETTAMAANGSQDTEPQEQPPHEDEDATPVATVEHGIGEQDAAIKEQARPRRRGWWQR